MFVATERTRLLIDVGLSRRETLARLASVGEDADRLDAILITHEHSDHIAGLQVLTNRLARRPPVFVSEITAAAMEHEEWKSPCVKFGAGTAFVVGDIEVQSFTIPHDAVDPVGFTLRAEGVRISVVTDLGYVPDSIKMHLRGTDVLLFEANHNLEMLRVGPYPWSIKQRILGRRGHLSNDAAFDFIVNDMDTSVSTLILGHLSEHNNYPTLVEQMAQRAFGERNIAPRLCVAEPGKQCVAFTY